MEEPLPQQQQQQQQQPPPPPPLPPLPPLDFRLIVAGLELKILISLPEVSKTKSGIVLVLPVWLTYITPFNITSICIYKSD